MREISEIFPLSMFHTEQKKQTCYLWPHANTGEPERLQLTRRHHHVVIVIVTVMYDPLSFNF